MEVDASALRFNLDETRQFLEKEKIGRIDPLRRKSGSCENGGVAGNFAHRRLDLLPVGGRIRRICIQAVGGGPNQHVLR